MGIKQSKDATTENPSLQASNTASRNRTYKMDATDQLSSTLNNLQLFQPSAPSATSQYNNSTLSTSPPTPQSQTFPLYPLLPSELRLKILTHTLPPPSIIRLQPQIFLSDSSFGLYLTFSISPSNHTRTQTQATSFSPPPSHGELTTQLQALHMTSLLLVSKETRLFYISKYSIALPTNRDGKGLIRIRKEDTLYLFFGSLLTNPSFCAGFTTPYRLQAFWGEIERLAVPVTTVMYRGEHAYGVVMAIVRACTGLKVLSGAMWDGFREGVGGEKGVRDLLEVYERYLVGFKGELEKDGKEDAKREGLVVEILEF